MGGIYPSGYSIAKAQKQTVMRVGGQKRAARALVFVMQNRPGPREPYCSDFPLAQGGHTGSRYLTPLAVLGRMTNVPSSLKHLKMWSPFGDVIWGGAALPLRTGFG